MTTHLTEQELLEHVLGTLDDDNARRVAGHCEACPSCREALHAVEASVDRIRSCEVAVDVTVPDLAMALKGPEAVLAPLLETGTRSRRRRTLEILRLAAVLCIGIGIGYVAAVLIHRPTPGVVRQQFVSRTIHTPGMGFVSCRVDGLVRR